MGLGWLHRAFSHHPGEDVAVQLSVDVDRTKSSNYHIIRKSMSSMPTSTATTCEPVVAVLFNFSPANAYMGPNEGVPNRSPTAILSSSLPRRKPKLLQGSA